MNMKVVVDGGRACAVYDDRLLGLFEALGDMEVARATNVEWDAGRREWVARLASTGEEIASGRNRAEVIRAEVEYLNRALG